MRSLTVTLPILLLCLGNLGCMPGGIITRGGISNGVQFIPAAMALHKAPYEIVCDDNKNEFADFKPAPTAPENGESATTEPKYRYVTPANYSGGCEEIGQHSTFYLFNLFPVTPPLNPEYAISTVVHRVEGDNMINIQAWHETHYYTILGSVSVFKVQGDVIRYLTRSRRKK